MPLHKKNLEALGLGGHLEGGAGGRHRLAGGLDHERPRRVVSHLEEGPPALQADVAPVRADGGAHRGVGVQGHA